MDILYEFHFMNNLKHSFRIVLDQKTITIIRPEPVIKPCWTKLEFEQCNCCPLDKEKHEFCPIALNIIDLIDAFKDKKSSDDCTVYCTTSNRTYIKNASIQEGLFSILGLIMATSNCPVMKLFKPMAFFHLPFSTVEETLIRVTSYYLLNQYFSYKKGRTPDLELVGLRKHYENVQNVNEGILRRINKINLTDADKNAIVILNSLAQIMPIEIEEQLESLEYLFSQS